MIGLKILNCQSGLKPVSQPAHELNELINMGSPRSRVNIYNPAHLALGLKLVNACKQAQIKITKN